MTFLFETIAKDPGITTADIWHDIATMRRCLVNCDDLPRNEAELEKTLAGMKSIERDGDGWKCKREKPKPPERTLF